MQSCRDRDTDDPLRGYVVRSTAPGSEGWMQGFVTCTNFTTWVPLAPRQSAKELGEGRGGR